MTMTDDAVNDEADVPGAVARAAVQELADAGLLDRVIDRAGAGLDPDRISFTTTLHAIRRTLPAARTSPDAALAETEASILAVQVPRREGRVCLRATARPSSPFPSRHNAKGPLTQHAEHAITVRHPRQAPQPPQPPDQTPPQPAKPAPLSSWHRVIARCQEPKPAASHPAGS